MKKKTSNRPSHSPASAGSRPGGDEAMQLVPRRDVGAPKKEEVYKLHIDVVPHVRVAPRHAAKLATLPGRAVARSAQGQMPSPSGEGLSDYCPRLRGHPLTLQLVPAQKKNKMLAFIWDKLQFVIISAVVFAAIYTVLNWQALLLNAMYYWDVWRGVESPLERLVAEKEQVPEKLDTASAQGAVVGPQQIPPLNLEVFPTDMRVVIPRINQNVPVVGVKNENLIARKWNELEADIQKSLRNGVVHYPGTSLPGDNGNIVITGHSSYYVWDSGRFKDVFALLHDVRMGDKVVVYFNQKKFVYEVNKIKVVFPKDVNILSPTNFEQLTLITCTPIGTNLKRLILTAKLIEKS